LESSDRQSKKVNRQSPAAITKVKKFFANREQQLPKAKERSAKTKYFSVKAKKRLAKEKYFSPAESGKW
jgi:hypothetical protein